MEWEFTEIKLGDILTDDMDPSQAASKLIKHILYLDNERNIRMETEPEFNYEFCIPKKVLKLHRKVKGNPSRKNIRLFISGFERFMKSALTENDNNIVLETPYYSKSVEKQLDIILKLIYTYYYHAGAGYNVNMVCPRGLKGFGGEKCNSIMLFCFMFYPLSNFMLGLIKHKIIDTILEHAVASFTPLQVYTGPSFCNEKEWEFLRNLYGVLHQLRQWKSTDKRLENLEAFKIFMKTFPNYFEIIQEKGKKEMQKESLKTIKCLLNCGGCGKSQSAKKTLLKCSRCKLVYYCDKKCQKAHWKAGHKKECVPESD